VQLTEKQNDMLIELVNIAFGRAAASLSELTGKRVQLKIPKVVVTTIDQLRESFENIRDGEITTISQIFRGAVAGNALLMLDYDGAVALCDLLSDRLPRGSRLSESDCDALTEVGNIMLNACLGTFGNLLQVHISFSVPSMRIESIPALFQTFTIEAEELKYAIVISTNFELRESSVGGYLIMVVGVSSLLNLLGAMDDAL